MPNCSSDTLRAPFVVHGGLVAVACIYGGWALLGKAAMAAGADPFVFATLRCFGGILVMLVAIKLMPSLACDVNKPSVTYLGIRFPEDIREDAVRICVLGFCMMANICGNILALTLLSAITVSCFMPMTPVITALLASTLGIEQLSTGKVLGVVCCCFGGIFVVVYGEHYHSYGSSQGIAMVTGLAYVFACMLGVSAGVVLQKPLLKKGYPPVLLVCMTYMAASIPCAIGAVLRVGFDSGAWSLRGGDSTIIVCILYGIFLTTALNYSVLAWGNKQTSPTTVTGYITLQPVATAVLSWAVLGELLTLGQLVGGLTIIIGLLLNIRSQKEDSASIRLMPTVPSRV